MWLGRLYIQKAAGICKHVARLIGSILAVPDSMSQLGIPMADLAHLLPVADDSPASHVTVPIVQSNSRRRSSSSTHRVSFVASESQLPRPTVNDQQPPSRFPVKAKVLNPFGEMFHVMLSYRDATERNYVSTLYKQLQLTGLTQERPAHMLMPTKWPQNFIRKHPKQCPPHFHTFLDKENLTPGVNYKINGFVCALMQSLVFVPVLSYKSEPPKDSTSSAAAVSSSPAPDATATDPAAVKHTGSIGQLMQDAEKLNKSKEQGGTTDNFLLELLLASELHRLIEREKIASASDIPLPKNEKRLPSSINACMSIFPIFIGQPPSNSATILDFCAVATNNEAKRILQALRLEPSQQLQDGIKVQAVLDYINEHQGAVTKDLGDEPHQHDSISASIFQAVSMIFPLSQVQLWHEQHLLMNRPLCYEMNVWLRQQNLNHIALHLSNNGITSVTKLSLLDTDDARSLAEQVATVTGRTSLYESAVIRSAVEAAKSSIYNRTINYRLANFVDKNANFLTAIRTQTPVVLICSKRPWMFIFFVIGFIFLLDGSKSVLKPNSGTQISAVNNFSFALLFFATCFGSSVFAPKIGSVLFRLGWVLVFLSNSVLMFFLFRSGDGLSISSSLDCIEARRLGDLKDNNSADNFNLCCNFYFYGYYLYFPSPFPHCNSLQLFVTINVRRYFEVFAFLIVFFLYFKESAAWRIWLFFGISANVLRAVFYNAIFDQQQRTLVTFVGHDHDVAVPAAFSILLFLLFVAIERVSKNAKNRAIDKHLDIV